MYVYAVPFLPFMGTVPKEEEEEEEVYGILSCGMVY